MPACLSCSVQIYCEEKLRMARAGRLLYLLYRMMRKLAHPIEQLAGELETCRATIYRDALLLRNLGYPIRLLPANHDGFQEGFNYEIPRFQASEIDLRNRTAAHLPALLNAIREAHPDNHNLAFWNTLEVKLRLIHAVSLANRDEVVIPTADLPGIERPVLQLFRLLAWIRLLPAHDGRFGCPEAMRWFATTHTTIYRDADILFRSPYQVDRTPENPIRWQAHFNPRHVPFIPFHRDEVAMIAKLSAN